MMVLAHTLRRGPLACTGFTEDSETRLDTLAHAPVSVALFRA
jgi:hypothetical protein